MCVAGCGFCLVPTNPGWGLWCKCLGMGFAFTQAILAGGWFCVFGCGLGLHLANPRWGVVCVCVCAGVLPVRRQSALGFVVCVFGSGSCVYSAHPGWGSLCLCLGVNSAFTPPGMAGVRGVCVWVWVSSSVRQSCLRFVVWLFGYGCCLQPASPGGQMMVCVCLGACVAFNLPILAGVWCICLCTGVTCTPAHPGWGFGAVYLDAGFAGGPLAFVVYLLGYTFCLHPANLGWSVGCMCLFEGSACTLQVLAWVCAVCVWVRVWLPPANPGCAVVCMCLFVGFAFIPPILAGVCGVCFRVRDLPSARQSWLGCGLRVSLCAHYACAPPILAGLSLGAGLAFTSPMVPDVCVVCVLVVVLPLPRLSWPGSVVRMFGCWYCLHPAKPR